jgi:hypothetical protein
VLNIKGASILPTACQDKGWTHRLVPFKKSQDCTINRGLMRQNAIRVLTCQSGGADLVS